MVDTTTIKGREKKKRENLGLVAGTIPQTSCLHPPFYRTRKLRTSRYTTPSEDEEDVPGHSPRIGEC
jgi:hypothetical protein